MFHDNSGMAKHTKKRAMNVVCRSCGNAFITGSSIKFHCSVQCRLKDADKIISDRGCWEWTGSLNPVTGYGQLNAWENGKPVLHTAHRVSYTAYVGEIPDGQYVLHKCDNRKCFNPEHLFLGTQLENVHDCINKGRFNRTKKPFSEWHLKKPRVYPKGPDHPRYGKTNHSGEAHPMSKLKVSDVLMIRQSDRTSTSLAKELGVSLSTVSCIRRGKIWTTV